MRLRSIAAGVLAPCLLVSGLIGCGRATAASADAAGGDGSPHSSVPPAYHEDGTLEKIGKSEEQWKQELTEQEFYVLRQEGTERPFTGKYNDFKGDGVFVCAGCGLPLYDSKTKFDSGTGWPSFYQAVDDDYVAEIADTSYGMRRVEVECARCGGHLGHVFNDGPKPTGQRHCINSVSLDFVDRDAYSEQMSGDGEAASTQPAE